MGYEEVIGNQSVYTKVVHEDPASGATIPIAAETQPGSPRPHKMKLGNEAFGHDSIPFNQIGAHKGHTGFFRVTMRFDTLAEAKAAGDWVAANVIAKDGKYLLLVDVPARNRANPNTDTPAEVRIDW